ncbi:alpha/beta hydrolase [Streptomyces sp. F001]|uniref:alpha/beta hydrolase family protein n=1 Tax=Streptomyces sp. F001 TaxID=1510026 RepID=UPI0019D092E7|nr:alpha/beta hydrolase [Streptomyces sp. F001]
MTAGYGPAPSQAGDLYLPPGDGIHPVVVLIHGGFWTAMLDRSQLVPLAQDLVDRGYAVWNIDYRGLGEDGGGWPGTLEDAAAAVDTLAGLVAGHLPGGQTAADSARGRLDLDRVVAIGHSAGGQLALWLASRPGLPAGAPGSSNAGVPLAAAVSLAGVLDLRAADADELGVRFGDPTVPPPAKAPAPARPELAPTIAGLTPHGTTAALLGGRADAMPDRYARLAQSNACHRDRHLSSRDAERRSPTQSRAYVAAARERGDQVECVEVPGADHFDVIDPGHPSWQAVVRRLPDLLKTAGD